MRKLLRRAVKLGIVAGIGYATWRVIAARRDDTGVAWEPQPFPYPPRPVAVEHDRVEIPSGVEAEGGPETDGQVTGIRAWVEPVDGVCPMSHPVKAKLASRIFHPPGGGSYERTKPDRCYLDAAAAERDGLRPSKR